MKNLFILSVSTLLLASCGGETKPTSSETKAVETQVAQDQAAMDSMEKVIQQQIDAISEDSLMEVKH
jgi:PBP1b-binding outer membrane lipoprotein LpoB